MRKRPAYKKPACKKPACKQPASSEAFLACSAQPPRVQVGDFVLHLTNPEMHVFSFITTDPAVIVLEDLHNVFCSMSWPSGPARSRPVFRIRSSFDDESVGDFADGRILECKCVRRLSVAEWHRLKATVGEESDTSELAEDQ